MSRTWRLRAKRAWALRNRAEAAPRESWGPGPWQEEADLYLFSHRGLRCRILRNHTWGILCGYVFAPIGLVRGLTWAIANERYEVHGSVTFCERWKKLKVIGFDCCHALDYWPARRAYLALRVRCLARRDPDVLLSGERYRSAAFVMAETRRLADQILDGPNGR